MAGGSGSPPRESAKGWNGGTESLRRGLGGSASGGGREGGGRGGGGGGGAVWGGGKGNHTCLMATKPPPCRSTPLNTCPCPPCPSSSPSRNLPPSVRGPSPPPPPAPRRSPPPGVAAPPADRGRGPAAPPPPPPAGGADPGRGASAPARSPPSIPARRGTAPQSGRVFFSGNGKKKIRPRKRGSVHRDAALGGFATGDGRAGGRRVRPRRG